MSPASHPLARRRATISRQRGMAIIGALIVVAAASVATAAIMERQTLLANTLIGERDRAQARWLLRGGLDWARVILFDDMRHNNVTIKRAIWAQPIVGFEISAPGDTRKAYFSGQIEDEQGKLNLWRLAEKGAVQPQELAALERLTAILGLPTTVAPAIAQRVAGAQASENGAQAAPGLRTIQDLLSIQDMSPDIVLALANYLTIVPEKTKINVNTASPEVLSATIPGLDLALARNATFQRDQGLWFASNADFFNRLNDPEIAVQNHVDVSSEWFKVTGEVSLDHASVGIQALLHRKTGGAPVIRWVKE